MPWTRNARLAPVAGELRRLLLEDADELGADDLALGLRVADALAAWSRKRSSASTATSGTWKVSRKAAMTCSPSFLRIRPWSTKTHVSWSPTARCTSSAATDESTPPLRPQMTRPSPTCVADARDLLLDDRRRRPRHVAAADVAEERLEDVLPVRACGRPRGGTGCRRCRARRPRARRPATRSTRPARVKPGGASKTVSRCDIQHACSAGSPASSRPGSRTRQRASGRTRRPRRPRPCPPSSSARSCMP